MRLLATLALALSLAGSLGGLPFAPALAQNSLQLPDASPDPAGMKFGTYVDGYINPALRRLATNSAGATQPASPFQGQVWLDTGGVPWLLKYWDGVQWVQVSAINPTTHVAVPVLGVATGTSLALGGCTLSSNVLCVAGSANVSGATTTSPGWYAQLTGDTVPRVRVGLNATDVPSIAFGPGNANRDAFIERVGAGSLRFGAPDAAAPVAQVLGVQNVATGTSNTAGVNFTFNGSQGTGTGAGGSILFQVAPAGSTGSAQNALAAALTIDSTKKATFAGAMVGNTTLAVGGGSIGSDAFEVTGSSTFNGALSVAGSSFGLSGSISAPAWTTNGVRYKNVAATLTDTSSSGTVAAAYTNVFGANTIAAASATTYTNYFNTYFIDPVAGSNVTLTAKWALGADSLRVGTSNQLTVSNAGVLNATAPVFAGATVTGAFTATTLAVGGGSIGSDAFEVTGSTTHNGALSVASSSFGLSGNISSAAWTTNGVRYKNVAATLTDTSSSGTVATAYTDVWGGNTIAASSATTFTNYYGSYYKVPTAGSNVTLTNVWGLGGDSLRIGTSNQLTVSAAGVLNATSPVFAGATVTGSFTATALVTNADLVNSKTTVNGTDCTLGSTCTITATAGSVTVGTTTVASGTTDQLLKNNGGTLGEVTKGNNCLYGTNGSGVASCLTALPSGVSQTGTGNVVLSASPTLSGTVHGNLTFDGTITASNDFTLSGANVKFSNIAGNGGGSSARTLCYDNVSFAVSFNNGQCTSSDARLKQDFAPLDAAAMLDAVTRLRPGSFRWRDDPSFVDIGVLAQEVSPIIPAAVTAGGSRVVPGADGRAEEIRDVLHVDYAKLVVPLIAAVQALRAENDALRARVGALEAR